MTPPEYISVNYPAFCGYHVRGNEEGGGGGELDAFEIRILIHVLDES